MQQVSFTVPLTPISVNHHTRPCKYRGKDGGLHLGFKLTKAARAYYEAFAIFARGETVAPQTDSERRKASYAIDADVYLGKGQRLDADNCGKQICDALVKAGTIHSDAYVTRCTINLHKEDRENPRTEIKVTRLENSIG